LGRPQGLKQRLTPVGHPLHRPRPLALAAFVIPRQSQGLNETRDGVSDDGGKCPSVAAVSLLLTRPMPRRARGFLAAAIVGRSTSQLIRVAGVRSHGCRRHWPHFNSFGTKEHETVSPRRHRA
jgi:hypothetical protein